MKYKCLVLDHDDTVVDSTRDIHFPSFVEYLKIVRPEIADNYTLESYLIKNFSPGVTSLFLDEVGLTEEEFLAEQAFWAEYVKAHIPKAFDGIRELVCDFKKNGGIVAVNSHSYSKYIERDYQHNGIIAPDIIYAWDLPKEKRKPSPFGIFDLVERYNLSLDEIVMVDDLKPGYDMAKAAGIDFVCAGWAYDIPEIRGFMEKNCDKYCKSVGELREFIGL